MNTISRTCTCFSHCRCESGHTARRPDVHPSQWAPLWVYTVSGWSACTRTRSPASAQLTHSQSPGRENAPRVSTGIQEGYWWALEQTMGNTERSKKALQSAKASNLIYLGFEDHNWKIWGNVDTWCYQCFMNQFTIIFCSMSLIYHTNG